jgi:PKHD-type hydroxylase
VPDVLDPQECDRLLGYTAEFGQAQGEIAREDLSGGELDPDVRRVRQTVVPRSSETAWVYERLAGAVDRCNQEFFGFDLRDFDEELAIVDYRAGDFYDWHLDFGREASSRKLSVSVALSPPEDYEGGALAFPTVQFDRVPRGSAVVFPSFLLHGVQPVKRGKRCALVAWVAGPRFR